MKIKCAAKHQVRPTLRFNLKWPLSPSGMYRITSHFKLSAAIGFSLIKSVLFNATAKIRLFRLMLL